jgi:hypothetical protein
LLTSRRVLIDIEDFSGANMVVALNRSGSAVAGDQPQDQDDGQGNTDRPEKNRAHENLR